MLNQPHFRKIIVGNATLYHGRCEDVLPLVTPVDCIVMDPPYEFDASGGGEFRKSRKYMDQIEESGLADGFDYTQFHRGRAYSVICFVHNNQFLKVANFLQFQFDRIAICFWKKDNPTPVHNKHYLPDIEIYVHAWNEGGHPLGKYHDKSRVICGPCGRNQFGHSTQKPDYVMDKVLANANGEAICDPYMGTGSTGVASVKVGRKFIGIEKEAEWFEVAVKRIADAQGLNSADYLEGAAHA